MTAIVVANRNLELWARSFGHEVGSVFALWEQCHPCKSW